MKLSYSNTFPSPTEIHTIIIQVLQTCKPIWDFNLLLFFDLHIIRLLEIKFLHTKCLHCLFTYWQYLFNFWERQIMVS
jgi:hypothetical protein